MTSAQIPSVDELVVELPEIYQPIYGHDEYASRASRNPLDRRLEEILTLHSSLMNLLGRPLRVLDLGCAQGWFSFNLAKAGATVLGIDILAANINICNRLALENRDLKVRFELHEIENLPERIAPDQFDLVLGLSVMHHLCHHSGKEKTREIMRAIFEKIPSGIFEFALPTEPMVWAPSLPSNAEYLVDDIPFCRVLSYHATHLSAVSRPLYFCSRNFWYLNGEVGIFETWKDSRERGRRYFFAPDRVVKLYRDTEEFGAINRNAIARECSFLKNPPQDYPRVPHVFFQGEAHGYLWMVREDIKGTLLSDMVHSRRSYDAQLILKDVLRELAALEKAQLYHADVRVWNVIVEPSGHGRLIDFNEITSMPRDCVWPWSPYLAFFLFVREVVTRTISYTDPVRQPFISPYNLPQPYQQWIGKLWNIPPSQWRFSDLLATLESLPFQEVLLGGEPPLHRNIPHPESVALWMGSFEEHQNLTTSELRTLEQLSQKLTEFVLNHKQVLDRRFEILEAAVHSILTNKKQNDGSSQS